MLPDELRLPVENLLVQHRRQVGHQASDDPAECLLIQPIQGRLPAPRRLDGLPHPLHREEPLPLRAQDEPPAGPLRQTFAVHHDLAGGGVVLRRRHLIQRVPGQDVLQPNGGVAHADEQERPRADADLHPQLERPAARLHGVEAGHRLLHSQTARPGPQHPLALGVVADEGAGDRVAAELDDLPVELLHDLDHRREVPVEDAGQLLRPLLAQLCQALRHRREAGDIGEQHRPGEPLLTPGLLRVRRGEHLLQDEARHVGPHGL